MLVADPTLLQKPTCGQLCPHENLNWSSYLRENAQSPRRITKLLPQGIGPSLILNELSNCLAQTVHETSDACQKVNPSLVVYWTQLGYNDWPFWRALHGDAQVVAEVLQGFGCWAGGRIPVDAKAQLEL